MSFLENGRSHKMVTMVTRTGLSSHFFFHMFRYRFLGKVSKFQEKIFIRSSVILEKPYGGWIPPPPGKVGLKVQYRRKIRGKARPGSLSFVEELLGWYNS